MELKDLQTTYRQAILVAAENNKARDVRVFGSVARGNATDKSDVDFIVNLKPDADLLDLSGLRLDLMDILKCDVDVVPENSLHWVIKDTILKEAIAL